MMPGRRAALRMTASRERVSIAQSGALRQGALASLLRPQQPFWWPHDPCLRRVRFHRLAGFVVYYWTEVTDDSLCPA